MIENPNKNSNTEHETLFLEGKKQKSKHYWKNQFANYLKSG